MTRLSPSSVAIGAVGGIANAALVVALIETAGYPVSDSTGEIAVAAVVAFGLGFVPSFVSAHTRLLAPGIGLGALLAGVAYHSLTTPPAEQLYELGGHPIVSGPTLFTRYETLLPVWIALSLVAGLAEFAIRRGYGLGNRRLRYLPSLPLSRVAIAGLVVGSGSLVGLGAAYAFRLDFPVVAFAFGAAVTVVPIAALLSRGLVAPLALVAVWVPRVFHIEAFGDPHGPFHLIFLGILAIACAIVAALEALLRSRYRGWDGGRFTGSADAA